MGLVLTASWIHRQSRLAPATPAATISTTATTTERTVATSHSCNHSGLTGRQAPLAVSWAGVKLCVCHQKLVKTQAKTKLNKYGNVPSQDGNR